MYRAFEPSVFPEGNFAAFVATLEKRLGPAAPQTLRELAPGITRRWREWRQGQTRLRAIDETQHLGCYVLIYEAVRAHEALSRRSASTLPLASAER